ncbi:MAG: Sporulation domain protein [Burkholderiales bacterium]|jgi:type II secretory pathway predicted ATPase ExeA|nr:Sporulation domain protein [Burkholderiales bacterium]
MALYLEHFGLSEPPFRITPHTDFFFEGADRGATLEALIYAILHDEGIVKVSGEVGSGKTMLCRVLMERLPEHVATIYLATPSLAREEILHAIADDLELRLSPERRSVALRELQEHLIRLYGAGRRVVILIDEAHVMPEDTLEQVRLLSNLESNRHKLLQIVLFGQPELDATLAKTALRQLRDRITHSFRMRPLAGAEIERYLSFRMRAAGYRGPELFTPRAVRRIARASGGLTRRINILADKSLLAAYAENEHAIIGRHVRVAVADSEFAASAPSLLRPAAYLAAALAAGAVIGAAAQWALAPTAPPPGPPPAAAAPAAPAVKAHEPAPPSQVVAAVQAPGPEPSPPEPAKLRPEPRPQLTAEQARRIAGYSPDGRPLLAERLAATRDTLNRAADEHYALELFITENTDPGRMEDFLRRARQLVPLEHLFVIPVAYGSEYRLWVAYGDFPNRQAAADASRQLPQRYQQAFRAAPRTFAEFRRAL